MQNIFKITHSKFEKSEILGRLKNYNDEIIDISELNMFEAAKTIIMINTYGTCKKQNKKLKYKVATKNIQNILNELPINNVEFV